MPHAAQGDQVLRAGADDLGAAAQDHGFHAIAVVQVGVQATHDDVVVFVLQ